MNLQERILYECNSGTKLKSDSLADVFEMNLSHDQVQAATGHEAIKQARIERKQLVKQICLRLAN